MIPFAETEQLYICGIEERDFDKIAALLDDPRVQRSKPVPVVLQADEWARTLRARGSIDGDAGMLACVLEAKAPRDADGKDGDRFVGLVELIPGHEVHRDSVFGIYLESRWWGRGFGTEATQWIVRYGFEQLALHRISLGVLADNPRAVELYKHIGFVEKATFRKKNWQDSKWGSMVYMGILRDEWPAVRDATRTGFVEPSIDCNVGTDGEHVRLGY